MPMILLAGLIGLTAQPIAAQPRSEIVRGGTLFVSLNTNPQDFDPMVQGDGASGAVTSNVFEGLLKYDDQLRPVPWLAEFVEQPDDLTYIFHLRRGVLFHDGTEMDAEAVKFSVDRIRANSASPRNDESRTIVESVVIDRYIYKLVLSQPYAPFLGVLTSGLGYVVSPTAVRRLGDADFNRNPVGTGPFKFASFRPNESVRVERFDRYWRMGEDGTALPYLDGVEWRIILDSGLVMAALLSGRLDIAAVPFADADLIRASRGFVYEVRPDLGFGYSGIILTIDRPPFDNKALRQALQFAIDRQEIIDLYFGGVPSIAHGPLPPPMAWATDPEYRPYQHDPTRAREKLREGGMPDGFSFTLWASDNSGMRFYAEILRDQLAEVGIELNAQYGDFNRDVVGRARAQESNAYVVSFSTGFDPDGALSARFLTGGGFNYFPYSNPAVDDLILRARRTSDRDERATLYRQAVPLIMEDSPHIFISNSPASFAGSARVKNWFLGPKATAGYSEYWLAFE